MYTKTFLSFLLFLGMAFTLPMPASAQRPGKGSADLSNEILRLVNVHRAKKGMSPLAMNEVISEAAEKHSRDMATGKVPFGHDGFDARMAKITRQIKPATGWAENVAEGPETAEKVVDMWLHSSGHKKNIEGKYNLTGIGIVRSKDGDLYYTQIFVKQDTRR